VRLTIALLGLELDLTFGMAGVEAEDEDPAAALNGGTTAAYPISFVGSFEPVDECALPMRNNGWGDEE
jgi:hypothetical protein